MDSAAGDAPYLLLHFNFSPHDFPLININAVMKRNHSIFYCLPPLKNVQRKNNRAKRQQNIAPIGTSVSLHLHGTYYTLKLNAIM